MARHDGLPSEKQNSITFVSSIIVFFLLILVMIGDALREFVRLIIKFSLAASRFLWRITDSTFRSLIRSLQAWTQLQKISLQKPVFTIRISKLRFPSLSLPTVRLPRFALPTFRLYRKRIPKEQIIFSEKRPSWQKTYRTRSQLAGFLAGIAATIVFFFLPYSGYQWLKNLPNPRLLAHRDLAVTTKIFDRNGVLLYEIYNNQNRSPVPLSKIPPYVKEATVAIEDQGFYEHKGFSIRGILRSIREIILHHQIQGGSTITQQLIKSALLTPEVTLSRKFTEIVLAFWAEFLYSKDQILEMYLNQVPYGGTSWGVEAAAQTYFGKSVAQLTLAEAALLAGLPAAPTEYSPFGDHPEKAFERQAEVLHQMISTHMITQEQANQALSEKIHFASPRVGIRAPHFVMYVKELLEERYGQRMVEQGGLQIRTSLDINIQEHVEDIVRSHIEALAPLHVGNGAVVVTDPRTGEILAMVGSKDYFDIKDQGNVNVATSLRQPGSSIKVVNYAAALESGFTAATILDDSPVVYNSPGSPPYAPVNYDSTFHGPTPLRYALANSYNIPAVKTLAKIGVHAMIQKGRLMGITSWQDESKYGLSLTLGGGDVTMLEMAQVYGTLADNGNREEFLPILEISDYSGRRMERNTPKSPVPAVNPGVAWVLTNILSDNLARSRAFGPNSALVIPGKTVAVKTGTSNDKRDNWTIGYTPQFVVTVWVGNNDNSPMDPLLTSGITGAAPIWHDVMVDLLKNKPDEVTPQPDIVVATPCYYGRLEYFIKGTEPLGGRCAPLPTPSTTPTPTP